MDETDNVEVATSATDAPVQDRPEWLPEKFKTPEDLVNSYSNLESRLGRGEEELRKTLKDEMWQEQFGERPDSAGDYALPDIIDEQEAVDNELLDWWSKFSYEHGFSQEKFADGIAKYAAAINGSMPDLDAERVKLGENADARIEAVQLWAQKNFNDGQMAALERLGETAEGIEVLEKFMDSMKSSSIDPNADASSAVTEADLQSMMKDERYWRQGYRDEAFVKKVQDGFNKLYG